jgi:hypothetical protein
MTYQDRITAAAFNCITRFEEAGYIDAEAAKSDLIKKLKFDFPCKTIYDIEEGIDNAIEGRL